MSLFAASTVRTRHIVEGGKVVCHIHHAVDVTTADSREEAESIAAASEADIYRAVDGWSPPSVSVIEVTIDTDGTIGSPDAVVSEIPMVFRS